MRRQEGMTLVELMVSLSIILVVMAVATAAYLKMLRSYKTQSKISQSYISDLTGLELLRYDVQMAGYGIPSDINGYTYNEAVAGGTLPTAYNPENLNDSPGNAPKPFAILPNGGSNGSDVLSIKSLVANINSTTKKWNMVLPGTTTVTAWGDSTIDFAVNTDIVIMMDDKGKLLPAGGGGGAAFNSYTFNGASPLSPTAAPDTSMWLIYGLSTAVPRMPFNRVDYYLDTVVNPKACAPNTFTLYRSVVSNAAGIAGGRQPNATPLIDCVYDFQVAFGLDNDSDQAVDTRGWAQDLAGMDATAVREHVREVRIFILYHEGVRDSGRSPDFRFSGLLNLGDQEIAASLDNTYDWPTNDFRTLTTSALTGNPQLSTFDHTVNSDYSRYRWKVLQLSIKPMNLKLVN